MPQAVTSSNTAVLFAAAGLLVAVSLLGHLQGIMSWLLQDYTGEKMVLDLRSLLFRHAQRLSLVDDGDLERGTLTVVGQKPPRVRMSDSS